jgi:glutathione S-transferase
MTALPGIRVWGIGTSRTMRPHWMLSELGLEYETREILPRTASMDDPDFKALNQRGKVPVFQQDDLVIGESGAIVLHLGERHRDRADLLPLAGSPERAAFDDLFLFALMELDAPLYVIRRHAGLPDVYGESPVAVEAAGQYFQRQVAVMDRRLADGRPYLMGSAFSAADILLSTCLSWAGFVKLDFPGRLQDYQARICGREAYAQALKRNFPPGPAGVPDASAT